MQEVNNTSALEEQLYYIGECKKFLEKKTKEIGRPLYACVHTFGFGAEIGISTQKLHARGPMGLKALTTTKYVIYGEGQIRQ
jgi:hypothetical protein